VIDHTSFRVGPSAPTLQQLRHRSDQKSKSMKDTSNIQKNEEDTGLRNETKYIGEINCEHTYARITHKKANARVMIMSRIETRMKKKTICESSVINVGDTK
jgi:hypothetical protein